MEEESDLYTVRPKPLWFILTIRSTCAFLKKTQHQITNQEVLVPLFATLPASALLRTLEFFHSNVDKPCLLEARFVHSPNVLLEHVRDSTSKWEKM